MTERIENILEQLEKDKQIISYLKTAYKEKTGEDINIPNLMSKIDEKEEEELEKYPNQKFNTFKDKVTSLNLPQNGVKEPKKKIDRLRQNLRKLDLSYFAGKFITIDLLKKIIEGLKIIKCVEEIDLSHNDLDDTYIHVIIEFLTTPGVKKINISHNKITSSVSKPLINCLKNVKNLEFFDITYNPFNADPACCILLCQAIKGCEKLNHLGINDHSRESALRLVSTRPSITSLNLDDSRYRKKVWDILSRYFIHTKYNLQYVSLKFCYIDFYYGVPLLAKGLSKNRTLISLNLYNTGLDDPSGEILIKSIINHKKLKNLDLGGNRLSTNFCLALKEVLKVNTVLERINLGKNNRIIDSNYKYVVEGLVDNHSIISLGDLIDTKIGVKFRECTEKIIQLNKTFVNKRVEKENELKAKEDTERSKSKKKTNRIQQRPLSSTREQKQTTQVRNFSKGRNKSKSKSPSPQKNLKKSIVDENPELFNLRTFNHDRKDELYRSVEIKKSEKNDTESIYPVDQSLMEPNMIISLERYDLDNLANSMNGE